MATNAFRVGLLVVLINLMPAAGERTAQAQSLDERVLRSVYAVETPAFRGAMQAADWSAYPAFVVVPAGGWAAALMLKAVGYEAPFRMTLAEGAALGGAVLLKHFYKRLRPSAVMRSIEPRLNPVDQVVLKKDRYSFPSGHAALSFAVAVSGSLSYPRWYVIGPSLGWAGAVAVSRIWIGVHYPSDVLVGAALGTAAAVGVHLLQDRVTPGFLDDEHHRAAVVPVPIVLRLAL